MSCMNCNDDDVVVLISHTGRTKSPVKLPVMRENHDGDRPDLRWNAPLAREATLTITLDVPEDAGDIYMPMVSTCS